MIAKYSAQLHKYFFSSKVFLGVVIIAEDPYYWFTVLSLRKWFEPRSNIAWLKKIIWVIRVLRRIVVWDWPFDKLCGSHLQSQVLVWSVENYSEDGFRTGCLDVSHKQQSFLGLQSLRRSFSINALSFVAMFVTLAYARFDTTQFHLLPVACCWVSSLTCLSFRCSYDW